MDAASQKLQIFKAVKQVSDIAALSLKAELIKQGHVLTGKLLNSIHSVINETNDVITAVLELEEYGFIVNSGVTAAKIPFTPGGRSGGRTSKYIEGLIKFFQLKKGLSLKNAKSAAFATANVHKREGMPSRNSYSFSNNGKRTGFIEDGLKKIESSIDNLMANTIDTKIFDFYLQKLSEVK